MLSVIMLNVVMLSVLMANVNIMRNNLWSVKLFFMMVSSFLSCFERLKKFHFSFFVISKVFQGATYISNILVKSLIGFERGQILGKKY
jgi:hypothetical protein